MHIARAAEQVVLEVGRKQSALHVCRWQVTFVDALLRGASDDRLRYTLISVLAPVRNFSSTLQRAAWWAYVVTLHDIDFCSVADRCWRGRTRRSRRVYADHASGLVVPSRYISRLLDVDARSGMGQRRSSNGVDSAVMSVAPFCA